MLTKRSILLLAIPALLSLPAGIATADNIRVQNDEQTVTIDDDNGIKVKSGAREIIVPSRSPVSIFHHRIFNLPRLGKSPRCQEKNYRHRDTQIHRSTRGVSRTHSSVSIRTCQ